MANGNGLLLIRVYACGRANYLILFVFLRFYQTIQQREIALSKFSVWNYFRVTRQSDGQIRYVNARSIRDEVSAVPIRQEF